MEIKVLKDRATDLLDIRNELCVSQHLKHRFECRSDIRCQQNEKFSLVTKRRNTPGV